MCSNVTSLPELVQGGAGLLFDPFDSQDIADQMLRWLRDPEDAAKYAEKASEKVQRDHGMESYITALNRIYDDITNRSGFAGSLITQTIRS